MQSDPKRLLCIALLCLGAIYVFRGGLNLYFAQEDFRGLAVGAGVYPRHQHLWRYVSVQAFMDVFYPLFRDRPWPYHAVSLAFHCVNGALLFALFSRHLTKQAAIVGATFFVVHPALFTALYWQSARADILAGTFALTTVILALRPGRERWLAVPSFALSLLSKEATVSLPAVIALLAWWRAKNETTDSAPRGTSRLLAALFLMSAGYLTYLARPREVGIAIGFDVGAAYAIDFGSSLLRNLLTYVGWTVDLAMLRPGLRFVDRQNPALFPFAVGVLVVVGLLALWPALRRRGWLVGLVGFLLLLVPVLPLRNHAYHYYLYLPLMAAALCLASLADVLLGQTDAPRTHARGNAKGNRPDSATKHVSHASWVAAGLCWLALTWNGARLVTQMEKRPSPVYPGLMGDPIVDRALIAERAIKGLRAAPIPSGTELVFIMRERIALMARIARGSGEEPPPSQEVYPETNVRAALFDGTGVRALVSHVDSVSFTSSPGSPAPHRRYAVYAPTGEVEVFDAVSLDSLLRSSWVSQW